MTHNNEIDRNPEYRGVISSKFLANKIFPAITPKYVRLKRM